MASEDGHDSSIMISQSKHRTGHSASGPRAACGQCLWPVVPVREVKTGCKGCSGCRAQGGTTETEAPRVGHCW